MTKQNINIKSLNKHSMTAVIEPKLELVYKATSAQEVHSIIKQVFDEYSIDTTASRRLLFNIEKSKTAHAAHWVVTNSVLAGNGLAV